MVDRSVWIAGVSALWLGLVVGDLFAACPTCGTQSAPPPPVYRCPACGQMVHSAPGPWAANPSYGWYTPPPATPYANHSYYGPRYPYSYPDNASPWVRNRQSAVYPAPHAGGMVPAPLPDPNFTGDIAYPQTGNYGAWTSIPVRPTRLHRESYYDHGYIGDSPWIRERRAQYFDEAWNASGHYPTAATVWQTYH